MVWVAVLVRADDCGALFMHLRMVSHQLTVGSMVVLAGLAAASHHLAGRGDLARAVAHSRSDGDGRGRVGGRRATALYKYSYVNYTPLSIVTTVPSKAMRDS